MSSDVQLHLTLILFAPWFAILSVLFWRYPRQPRGVARTVFDSVSLVLAAAAALAGTYWGMREGDASYGHMWKQILATSVAYGLYLAAMTLALLIRMRWLRGARAALPTPTGA